MSRLEILAMVQPIAVTSFFAALLTASQLSAEVLTYRFTGDEPAYRFSCGECSGLPYITRARLEGTFQVSLDREGGFGSLLTLDARLVENEGLFGNGVWQPYGVERDFLPDHPWYDAYRPPLNGSLQPADVRPLGPNTLAHEHLQQYTGVLARDVPLTIQRYMMQNIGFEPAPAHAWSLSSDGILPLPDGDSVAIISSFEVYFEGNQAFLTYFVPIIDATPEISAARATLIPEPTGSSLVLFGLTLATVCHRQAVRRTNFVRVQ
jgi:hypothetical protein